MFSDLVIQRYVFYPGIYPDALQPVTGDIGNSTTFEGTNLNPMKYLILLFCALVSTGTYSQSEAGEEVKAAIEHFFDGFHKRDTAMMRTVLHQEIQMQRIGRNSVGSPVLVNEKIADFLTSMTKLPDTLQIEERLLDYHIQTDGNLANVWTPYEFYLQGKFHHCGVNSFQLFREPEGWKIIYIIDTRRVKDCDPGK